MLNNSTLMKRHEHRCFDGDVLFVTAAAPRPETWLSHTTGGSGTSTAGS
ncbi:MAG: hypothetical protein QM784_19770 [Polyangiaceae bacterium]